MRRAFAFAFAFAFAPAFADEDDEMGRRLQDLLHAHAADVYGCTDASKKEPDGELLMRVIVGDEGRAARVQVLKDQTGSEPALADCLAAKIRGWDLTPLRAAAGDQVVFPLGFHPENPYLAPPPALKSDAKVAPNVRWHGGKASLTLLKLAASVRLAAHTHPSGEAVYVLKGMLRVRQPGRPQESLKAGDAAFFAAGEPHSLEAAPLAPVEVLQIFTPAGPEEAYGNHQAGGTTPSKQASAKPAWLSVGARPLPIPKGSIRLLLDGSGAPIALDELTAESGAAIPPHKHDGSDELLYIVEGKGTTTVAGRPFAVSAGDSLRIPAGLEHALKVDEKLTAVQVYAPAGPEQRFKK